VIIELLPKILLLAGLIGLSGFFSGAETSLFSLQAVDRERLREQGSSVIALLENPSRTLASVLMGNELVNISLSSVCAGVILELAPDMGWLNLLVATPLLILFGEVTPKTIALRAPRRFANFVAKPLSLWATLITPIRVVLTGIANLALRILGAKQSTQPRMLEEEQVRRLVDEGLASGSIKSMEHELIHRVFSFSDAKAGRLMTPRPDIVSVPLSAPYEQVLSTLRVNGYSRLPVYQGRHDEIVGILLSKDLLRFKGGPNPTHRQIRDMLQPPLFVPKTKNADELLRELKLKHLHMAIVVDEHGTVAGLVTLDDLLVELVGADLDEDDDSAEVSRIRPGLLSVSAGMDIEDFREETGLQVPNGEYHTIGGYVLNTLGHLPHKGEELEREGARFTVVGVEGRRITELTVELLQPLERSP